MVALLRIYGSKSDDIFIFIKQVYSVISIPCSKVIGFLLPLIVNSHHPLKGISLLDSSFNHFFVNDYGGASGAEESSRSKHNPRCNIRGIYEISVALLGFRIASRTLTALRDCCP